jgi:hypothetical protein
MVSERALAYAVAVSGVARSSAPRWSRSPVSRARWAERAESTSRRQRDLATAIALAALAALISYACLSAIDPQVYDSFNIYFQADPPRVISNMTERESPWQNATFAHPIFSILSFTAVQPLRWGGLSPLLAVHALVIAAGSGSSAMIYLAIRALGLPWLPAAGFAAMFLSSAAYLHWYGFIETFPFAGLSVVAMILVLVRCESQRSWPWVVAASLTLGITITNFSMAMLAACARLSRRNMLAVLGASVLTVLGLAVIQRKLFHGAFIFLFHPDGLASAVRYNAATMQRLGMAWDPWVSARAALLMGGVVPPPSVEVQMTDFGPWTLVNNQHADWWNMPPTGIAAAAAWLILLGLGCWGVLRSGRFRRPGVAVMAFVTTQILLHSFYGEITFLYVADYCAAMIILMAYSWFTPLRRLVLPTILLFIFCGGINNFRAFLSAASLSRSVAIAKAEGHAFGAF